MGTEAAVPQVIDRQGLPLTPAKAPRLSSQAKKRFCVAFATHFNKKKAVEQAGITHLSGLNTMDPMSIADRLLGQAEVIAYLNYLRDHGTAEYQPSRAWIREQIVALAGFDVTDALEFSNPDPEGYVRIKQLRLDKVDGRAISGIRVRYDDRGRQQVDIKFQPKTENLKMLATEAGMLGKESQAPAVVHFHYDLRGA